MASKIETGSKADAAPETAVPVKLGSAISRLFWRVFGFSKAAACALGRSIK
ncbi:MAG: hypothetical protein O3B04_00115 [Chloroflexi bacterium]|nr:hypothetical protein [Chloroflexota bacterium]MDA1296390.1 hypothetical protein [Chloroflexota bacterium]